MHATATLAQLSAAVQVLHTIMNIHSAHHTECQADRNRFANAVETEWEKEKEKPLEFFM